jgi:hypothetical protein
MCRTFSYTEATRHVGVYKKEGREDLYTDGVDFTDILFILK